LTLQSLFFDPDESPSLAGSFFKETSRVDENIIIDKLDEGPPAHKTARSLSEYS